MSENIFNRNYSDDDDASDAVAATEANVSNQVTKRIWQPTIEDTTAGVWEPPEKPMPHLEEEAAMSPEAKAEALAMSETASGFIREVERSLYGDKSKDPEMGSAEYFKAAEDYSLYGNNFMDFPKSTKVAVAEDQKTNNPPPGFEQNSNQSAVHEGNQMAASAGVSGQSCSAGPSSSGMGSFALTQHKVNQHKVNQVSPPPPPLAIPQHVPPRHPSPVNVARAIAEVAALAGAGAGIDIGNMTAHGHVPTATEMAIGQLYQQLMNLNLNRANRQHQQQHQQQQQQAHQLLQQQQQANQLLQQQQQQLQVSNPGIAAAAMMYANIELQQHVSLRQIQLHQIRHQQQQQQQQRAARGIYGANGKATHATQPKDRK